jgi:hypothetical protein
LSRFCVYLGFRLTPFYPGVFRFQLRRFSTQLVRLLGLTLRRFPFVLWI